MVLKQFNPLFRGLTLRDLVQTLSYGLFGYHLLMPSSFKGCHTRNGEMCQETVVLRSTMQKLYTVVCRVLQSQGHCRMQMGTGTPWPC